MVKQFVAVLIICCLISAARAVLHSCYIAASNSSFILQRNAFSTDFIPMVSYFIAVFVICFIASAARLLKCSI